MSNFYKIISESIMKVLLESEQDDLYLKAYQENDVETAMQMVLQAAKAAMPNTKFTDGSGMPLVAYHSTPETFNEFDLNFAGNSNSSTYLDAFYFSNHAYGGKWKCMKCFLNAVNPLVIDLQYAPFDSIGAQEVADLLVNRGSYSRDFNEYLVNAGIAEEDENGSFDESIAEYYENIGVWDGRIDSVMLLNTQYDAHSTEYIVFKPNQIKSAEPFTFDDSGNLIPLSQRFDFSKNDIRY